MTNVKSRDALVDMPSSSLPNLATRVTLDDFHDVAKAILPGRAYIYASSASNNERRVQHYNTVWSRLFFRPRIMRNVSIINPTTHMLSFKSRYPFFIAPMGLVGTVHAEGELALARAAAQRGIHYCISTAATKSHEEVITSFRKEQKILETVNGEHQSEPFFQLYVNSQRHVTQELLRKIRRLGYKGLLITVDTPVIGKRNADRELQAREMVAAGLDDKAAAPVPAQKTRVEGGRAPPGVLSSSLNWNDLVWIRKEWDGPIVLKGVQCAADVKMAADAGVHGVYLSNHGGRQLRDAPSSLHTLLETRALYPEVLGKIEIFVDGGFSTGADILKAICLGAKAVGIGRPFIYAVAGYGVEGALKTIDSKCQLRGQDLKRVDMIGSPSRRDRNSYAVVGRDESGSVGARFGEPISHSVKIVPAVNNKSSNCLCNISFQDIPEFYHSERGSRYV